MSAVSVNGHGPRYSPSDPWIVAPAADHLIPESNLPPQYREVFEAASEGAGSVSSHSLAKLLRGANLSPSDVDKIMNLTGGRGKLSSGEFSVALALIAFAQQKQDISIESVVSHNATLPIPRLASTAALSTSRPARPRRISLESPHSPADPWGGAQLPSRPTPGSANGDAPVHTHYAGDWDDPTVADTSGFSGHEGEESVWRPVSTADLEKARATVDVNLASLAGRYLNKYIMYEVVHSKHIAPVMRRFSDFAWLHLCLERRYPFRLLPSLPPKRLAINGAHAFADDGFLDRRRRGLQRYASWIANHHVLKNDGLVGTFFTERDLTAWRTSSPVSLEEESSHRRLSPAEEMSIPSDLEAKLADFRARLPALIEHWTKACQALERIVRRREAQASDLARLGGELDSASLADQPDASAGGYRPPESEFVERDLGQTSEHLESAATALESRAATLSNESLERLKAHRALYSDFGALLGRQDRLAPDAVDKLNRRIELALARLELVRQEKKDKWEEQAEKLTSVIEHDQRTVEALLRRRIFIRFAMWEELRFHFRSARLLQVTLRGLSEGERTFDDRVAAVWRSLAEALGPLV